VTWDDLTPPYATIVVDPPWPYDDGPTGIQRGERGGRPKTRFLPYSTMSLHALRRLKVESLAAPGAHLFLWTTQRFLWDAKPIAEHCWGWKIQAVLTWCKEPMGLGGGGTFTPTTEFLLYGRRPVGALIQEARKAAGLSIGDLEDRIRGKRTWLAGRWEEDDCFPTPRDWTCLREHLPALQNLPDLAPDANRFDSTWWRWKRGQHSQKPPAALDMIERVSPAPRVELFARAQRLGWDSWGWGYEGAAS
jgi:N6-adenosine-specific RNA methylase IME4